MCLFDTELTNEAANVGKSYEVCRCSLTVSMSIFAGTIDMHHNPPPPTPPFKVWLKAHLHQVTETSQVMNLTTAKR